METVFDNGHWENLFDALPEAIAVVDTSFRVVWINRSMSVFLGRPAGEVLGRRCHETLHDAEVAEEVCPACPLKGGPGQGPVEIELPARKTWARIAASPFFDAAGKVAGAIHFVSDITDRKLADQRADLSSARLNLLNGIGNLVLQETDIGTVLDEAAHGVCGLLEVPRCTIRLFAEPERLFDHCDPGFPSVRPVLPHYHCSPDSMAIIESGRNVVTDDIRRCSFYDGSKKKELSRLRLGAFLGVPVRGRGKLLGALFLDRPEPHAWSEDEIGSAQAVARQIAIALRHDQIFREQQDLAGQLLSLINNVPGVAYRGFRDWSVNFMGTGIYRFTGHTAQEFTSGEVRWPDLVHPDDLVMLKRLFHEAVHARNDFLRVEYRFRHRDGSIRWLVDRRKFIYDAAGNFAYVDGLIIDITDRKRAEEVVREAGEKLMGLIQASPLAIMCLDPDGIITMWNLAAERIFGWSEEEVLDRPNPIVPEDKRQEFQALLDRSRQGIPLIGVEARRRKKDGSPIDVRIWTSLLRDGAGKITSIMVLYDDITERKQMEEALRQSEERFRQAQKMEAVGRLAGGIAHDFNNLLTAIRGYSDLLLHRLDRGSPLRREVEEIRKAGDRAASLTHQLLAFSRKQMLQPKVLDLCTVVAGMDMMLRRLIGEDIDLITVLEPDPWKVRVDPGQIEQVIMNLVINARDAMPRGGKVIVETANVFLGEDDVRRHADVPPGPYVMLSISDTGSGMDKETRSRLFEPFFTTKETGKGTGLGLSTVYGIVKQSGGDVLVESEVGKGSTFKVFLPRLAEDPARDGAARPSRALPRGHETLLLVEDDEMVRRFALDVLQGHGYTVLAAHDGVEALETAKTCMEKIHMVITDVVMPRMGGRELVESLGRYLPGAKVLYMSGYTDETILLHGVMEKETALLQKPFTVDALVRKVREVLDS
ncbi:MAG: PAS domain S-box protein [Deltaproteobacteria bacterium]|nr:PAS domain S-box protein [Deltaproteobacteria bacterium]